MRKTNRDYTGLVRTPSSMSWLIDKRSRATGKLERCERELERIPQRMLELKAEIEAIDVVMGLHEVGIEPSEIQPKAPRAPRLGEHGAVTRAIYKCLRMTKGRPQYTMEVALYVAHELKLDLSKTTKSALAIKIRSRLRGLRKEGKVRRLHDPNKLVHSDGQWSLLVDEEETVT